MFHRISSKLVTIIVAVFFVNVAVLISIVSYNFSDSIQRSNDKLLEASVNRYINYIQGNFQELATLLESISNELQDQYSKNNWEMNDIENTIKANLDASDHAAYAFLYIPKPLPNMKEHYPMYTAPNGRLMMLFKDNDVEKKGASKASSPTLGSPKERLSHA
ncbi:hypothetical protein [Campylobacter sp.]|uniref:hypothetical protein n=1 Tax=Campylobacter sp. TaxID=205 RepID=UPI0026DCEAC6|nr:hypothetical protein [Campylobacter sp.]MDO4673645.1 hypothetical protein [Campylobacter sp.]